MNKSLSYFITFSVCQIIIEYFLIDFLSDELQPNLFLPFEIIVNLHLHYLMVNLVDKHLSLASRPNFLALHQTFYHFLIMQGQKSPKGFLELFFLALEESELIL